MTSIMQIVKSTTIWAFALLFAFGFSSCMTEKAVVKRKISLHSNSSIVEPAWELQKTGATKAFPYVMGAAGAGVGYFSEFDYDGESYSGSKGALMLGLGGLLGSVLLQEVLLPSNKRRRYVPSEREEWMESLNRQSRDYYLAFKEYKNDHLLLVPQYSSGAFAQRAQAYKDRGKPIEGRNPGKLMAKNNNDAIFGALLLFGAAALMSSDSGSSGDGGTCNACNGHGSIIGPDGIVQNCGCGSWRN